MSTQKYIQPEDVISWGSIQTYVPYLDQRSGTVEWYDSESDRVVYATPNWEEEGTLPIAHSNIETGDYTHVGNISLVGMSLEEQKNKYLTIVEEVLLSDEVIIN